VSCFLVLIAYYSSVTVLRIVDILPPRGPILFGILIALGLLKGALFGCAAVGFNSMIADAADEHEFLFGSRRESLFFAGLNFSVKAANGLGALISGLALELIRFPTQLAAQGGGEMAIDPGTLTKLGLIYGPGVALLYAVATLIFLRYRLDRSALAKIQSALGERRKAAARESGDLSAAGILGRPE